MEQHISDQLVHIPGGIISMRDDRTKDAWTVPIASFWLGKYPITQAQYRAITGEAPSYFAGKNRPVESISWYEAIRFCNQLSHNNQLQPYYSIDTETDRIASIDKANGFRLPTEAEWQYACQAGSKQVRYGKLTEIGWYRENSGGATQEVGQKLPNEWGLFDMLGNVWEWCEDLYDQTVYGSYRVFRGGGWADEERGCLATNRRRSHPSAFRMEDLGFRVARNNITT